MGHEYGDDAVVVRLPDGTAVVQTLDFFTPVVDDPYHYGKIAAANSLSDVYAMGGTPVAAMNVTCFPTRSLGPEVLGEILRGGYEKLQEAGAVLAGGHTVEDQEPKYGLAVTGVVDARRIVTKGGAAPGDHLILTKPIGTGVLTTAHKKGELPDDLLALAVAAMETLNAEAARLMVAAGVRGGTDITGYGLLGHALEMCRASGVAMQVVAAEVPLLPGALEFVERGFLPGGSRANRRWLEEAGAVSWAESVSEPLRALLTDAQTSGGLLMAVSPEAADELLQALPRLGQAPRRIGRVLEAGEPLLRVV